MARRHPLPDIWLFTDPRLGAGLEQALDRLPRGAGVILRDYAHPDRAAFARRLRKLTQARAVQLFVAGDAQLARRIRADGVHLPSHQTRTPHYRRLGLPLTAAAHDAREVHRASRAGAQLVFISPVYPTRSHPGAPVLGRLGFARLARGTQIAVGALGGVTSRRYRALRPLGAAAWGAIDAFAKD